MEPARTKRDEAVTGEGEFVCGCGRRFTHGAWYTKHKLKCDGKPVPTRGRIERLAARAGRAVVPARRAHRRRPGPGPQPAPQTALVPLPAQPAAIVAAAATEQAIQLAIAGLQAKRAVIDNAIAALQAVG